MALGAAIVVVMAIHVITDVMARYIFDHPLPGTIEIVSDYYMVATIYLPLAYVQSRRRHIVVHQFTDWLPLRGRLIIDAFSALLTMAVLALLAWRGTVEALRATAMDQQTIAGTYSIAAWPPRWLAPLGLGVMSLQALSQSIHDLVAGISAHPGNAAEPTSSDEDW